MKKVILNEQHSLLESQKSLLGNNYEVVSMPAEGMSHEAQKNLAFDLAFSEHEVVFASCPPLLLGLTTSHRVGWKGNGFQVKPVYVFANEKREKKELPNGKIISVTAQEGWELLEVV